MQTDLAEPFIKSLNLGIRLALGVFLRNDVFHLAKSVVKLRKEIILRSFTPHRRTRSLPLNNLSNRRNIINQK